MCPFLSPSPPREGVIIRPALTMDPDGRATPCLSFKLIDMDPPPAPGPSLPAAAAVSQQTSSVSRLGRLHSHSSPQLSAEQLQLPPFPWPGDLVTAKGGALPQPLQPDGRSYLTLPITGGSGLRTLMEFVPLSGSGTDYDSSAPLLQLSRMTLSQAGPDHATDSLSPQQQMGLIRGLSILSEMPVMVTLLDLQAGNVVFQNDRSLRWVDNVTPQVHVTPGHTNHHTNAASSGVL